MDDNEAPLEPEVGKESRRVLLYLFVYKIFWPGSGSGEARDQLQNWAVSSLKTNVPFSLTAIRGPGFKSCFITTVHWSQSLLFPETS